MMGIVRLARICSMASWFLRPMFSPELSWRLGSIWNILAPPTSLAIKRDRTFPPSLRSKSAIKAGIAVSAYFPGCSAAHVPQGVQYEPGPPTGLNDRKEQPPHMSPKAFGSWPVRRRPSIVRSPPRQSLANPLNRSGPGSAQSIPHFVSFPLGQCDSSRASDAANACNDSRLGIKSNVQLRFNPCLPALNWLWIKRTWSSSMACSMRAN